MSGQPGNKKVLVKKISKDNNRKILIIETEIETETFILLNLYNSNSEIEQLQTFSDVCLLSFDFSVDETKARVCAGNFNLFFNKTFEALDGNPVLEKKSISRVLQITKKKSCIDVQRVRNPSFTRFSFTKNHFSGFI